MNTKLDWVYQNDGECHAFHNGYRIRAVHDDDASNPFENDEGLWPIIVRVPDHLGSDFSIYEGGKKEQGEVKADIAFIPDAQLVHDQHAILKALGWGRADKRATTNMKDAFETYSTEDPVGYCTDADILRDLFQQVLDDNSNSSKLDQLCELHLLAGSYAYCTQVNGYSQGDWSEVLVVADKATIEKFGCETHIHELRCAVLNDPSIIQHMGMPQHMFDEYVRRQVSEKLLKPTTQLYRDWAFGDTYGYIIEKLVRPETCFDCNEVLPDKGDECTSCDEEIETEWKADPDGSCWGFYGSDFAESGLEESALECVPDPEPVMEEA